MKSILILCLACLLSFKITAQKELEVFVFLAEECPISIYMTQPLQEVVKAFGSEVKFTAVFPKKNSTSESANEFLKKYHLTAFEILLDPEQTFTKKYGASITPEVIILDTEKNLVYRGRISDAYRAPGKMKHGARTNDLKINLGKLISGAVIKDTEWTAAVGCYITFY